MGPRAKFPLRLGLTPRWIVWSSPQRTTIILYRPIRRIGSLPRRGSRFVHQGGGNPTPASRGGHCKGRSPEQTCAQSVGRNGATPPSVRLRRTPPNLVISRAPPPPTRWGGALGLDLPSDRCRRFSSRQSRHHGRGLFWPGRSQCSSSRDLRRSRAAAPLAFDALADTGRLPVQGKDPLTRVGAVIGGAALSGRTRARVIEEPGRLETVRLNPTQWGKPEFERFSVAATFPSCSGPPRV